MKNKIVLVLASIILVFIVSSPFIFLKDKEEIKSIGGDTDDYGCLISAGYSYCPTTEKCQRMWEEYCEDFKDVFKIFNFDDCVEAGNSVMESYPRQCEANGEIFVEEINLLDSCGIPGANWLEEEQECEYVPKDWCESKNGEFSECESACRHEKDAEICTTQCVPVCKFVKDVEVYNYKDLIRLENPLENEKITSPLTVKGEARGDWFFEGDFSVVLTNWDGLIIAEGFATASDTWMTEDLVSFEAMLEFEKPELYDTGSLILKKDNPSGLPENDDAFEIKIFFE